MSRSPFKPVPKPAKTVERRDSAVDNMLEETTNPFVRRGLRRSPPAGSQADQLPQDLPEQNINPFERRGLRRSPVSSQVLETVGDIIGQNKVLPKILISEADVLPSGTTDALVIGPPQSQPEPVMTQETSTTQSTEAITLSGSDRPEEAQSAPKNTERPKSTEPTQVDVTPEIRGKRERHLEDSSRKHAHVQAAEPLVVSRNHDQPKELEVASKTTEPKRSSKSASAVPSYVRRDKEHNLEITLNRSHRSSQVVHPVSSRRKELEQPELPPTPTQLGIPDPIVTTPPTGIHDTPSKRAKKKQKAKSSPLKPRDPPPPAAEAKSGKPKRPQTVVRRRSSRFLVPEDPHASKKKTRDDLLKQIEQLRADVALGNKEIERLRLEYESRKPRPTAPSNPDEILGMLLRATEADAVPKRKASEASIFKSIESFLPFTSRRKRQIVAIPASNKPIPSHLPVAIDNSLPYLQVFSPLVYTSAITLLPPVSRSPDTSLEETDHHILQRHLINASHPSGLFAARFSMTVDSSSLSITSLDIGALPSNAEKELGTFIRGRWSPDAMFNRDIGVVCWAMGRWVEVSISRAKFWCAVEEEFGTSEARAKSFEHKVRKRKRVGSVILDENDDGNKEAEKEQKWTMRQLLPHMGQTAIELSSEEVELRFEWKISFDWTGEVESAISASARLPRSCESVRHFLRIDFY